MTVIVDLHVVLGLGDIAASASPVSRAQLVVGQQRPARALCQRGIYDRETGPPTCAKATCVW